MFALKSGPREDDESIGGERVNSSQGTLNMTAFPIGALR